jgi:hypothetical protein
MADGLGVAIDRTYIADWLAAKPKGFLADVSDTDVQGSEFDSGQTRGPLRVVKNTQESAWWSKHLSNRMVVYLSVILLLIIVAAFITLTLCIWEKSDGFIVAVAADKEWIHSGNYTITN